MPRFKKEHKTIPRPKDWPKDGTPIEKREYSESTRMRGENLDKFRHCTGGVAKPHVILAVYDPQNSEDEMPAIKAYRIMDDLAYYLSQHYAKSCKDELTISDYSKSVDEVMDDYWLGIPLFKRAPLKEFMVEAFSKELYPKLIADIMTRGSQNQHLHVGYTKRMTMSGNITAWKAKNTLVRMLNKENIWV